MKGLPYKCMPLASKWVGLNMHTEIKKDGISYEEQTLSFMDFYHN